MRRPIQPSAAAHHRSSHVLDAHHPVDLTALDRGEEDHARGDLLTEFRLFLLAYDEPKRRDVENESGDEELYMSDTNIACWET